MQKKNSNFKVRMITQRILRGAGVSSAGILGFLGIIALSPITSKVDAANGWDKELKNYRESASTVTLSMDSGTNSTINAGNTSTNVGVVKRTASVTLGNTNGYSVYIKANSPNLIGQSASNTIPSVTSNSTLAQMTDKWGWNGNVGDNTTDCSLSDVFKQMTTSNQTLGTGGAMGSGTKKVTMCFGTRVSAEKAADTYSNTVTLSVVAQPGRTATFGGISTMQQMTPSICSAANYHETTQLTDTRDNKKYWVTKLLDGNCWMSQNLALNITLKETGSETATSNILASDSDVKADWVYNSSDWYTSPPRATTADVTVGSATNTGTYSWNLGDYVVVNPTVASNCASNNTGLSACTAQFMAVGNRTPSADPNFYRNNGNKTYTDTEYDAHYLVGNYYQWNTATAGSGMLAPEIEGSKASESICPKGWKLPNMTGVTGNGSFRYVLRQYGLASESGDGTITGTSEVNQNTYNLTLSPFFFVRSGTVSNYNSNMFGNAGLVGGYWSSIAGPDAHKASVAHFSSDSINPSIDANRYIGYSVRCVVKTP